MFIGTHLVLFSSDPEADRTFFRDVLGFPSVDAGHGWLIFKVPPAEAALHPADGDNSKIPSGHAMLGCQFYLMCDDLSVLIQSLAAKKVICEPIETARWGIITKIRLPSGGEIGLYQPLHPTALGL